MSEIPLLSEVQQLYMGEVLPEHTLPKHYIWQSPLLLPQDSSDLGELDQRIRQAGLLWLKNNDMRPFQQLVITHKQGWLSYVFQRAKTPNQYPITVGPIARRLINKGNLLSPYPLIYQEFTEIWNFNLW